MKKLLLLLLLVATTFSFGQSANLDRAYFNGAYTKLPSNPILDASKRTYSTNNNQLYISGFTKTNPATLTVNFQFNGTSIQFIKINKRESIKKDKDGNVISRKMYYSAISEYTSKGSFSVDNAITGKTYRHPYSYRDKNTSPEYTSYSKAANYYNNNKYSLRTKYRNDHRSTMLREANDYLNGTYGYPVYNSRAIFWILGKKKHPEYAKHRANYEKAKKILAKMKADEPIDAIEKELQPVIDYFIATAKKYVGKKKRMRKMRYASYYNLAKIYYYLDNPAKTKEYGEKIIANGKGKADGKYFIRIANTLQARFNANKTTSRHFSIQREAVPSLDQNNEEVLAYLITKANDTIQTVIPANSIAKIGYSVDLEVTDNSGKKAIKRYMAEDCKTLALTNEDMYQVVDFEEAKKGEKSTAIKFVKVLFESDKIGLYLFNQQELVLKLPNEAKGVSTKLSKFAFGLNKELGKYAANCPEALAATQAKEFKNTAESLTKFCKMLTTCK